MNLIETLAQQPFTLALSSGFFGFYAHVGFMKALTEVGLNPSAFSGSSAGAIIAAATARGLSVKEIENLILRIGRKDFWDPYLGLGVLRGRKLQELIAKEIGSDFNQLQKSLHITVFDIANQSTHFFNSGNLARVIRASCAVPFMFHPVRIDRRFYWDGGITDKMGIHGLPQENVILSHYLESSRDPHSFYERKRDEQTLRDRGNKLIQIKLKNLPRANPFAMHRGPDIIHEAYRQTLERLTTSF